MELDLGGVEKIVDPTEDDVRHYLKYMPAESPWIILSRNDESFIQSTCAGEEPSYRVEYRCEGQLFLTHVNYDKAVSLFLCFLDDIGRLDDQANWKKLHFLNPRIESWLAWSGLIFVLGLLIVWGLYELGLL